MCVLVCVAVLCTGGFSAVMDNLWLGKEESEAIAMALQPKLSKTQTNVEALLHDVATLEVGVGAMPVCCNAHTCVCGEAMLAMTCMRGWGIQRQACIRMLVV